MEPYTKDKYLGIEIECLAKIDPDEIEDYLEKHRLENILDIADDSSIKLSAKDRKLEHYIRYDYYLKKYVDDTRYVPSYHTYEFKILTKQQDLSKNLQKVAAFLKDIGAKVNPSCGLHVHLDCRNRPFLTAYTNLVNYQDILFKMVPKSRRNNTYCQKTNQDDIMGDSRYKAINHRSYSDLQTIEVRLHDGTVDCEEIENWCKLICSVADGVRLTEGLKKYVRSRTKRFA